MPSHPTNVRFPNRPFDEVRPEALAETEGPWAGCVCVCRLTDALFVRGATPSYCSNFAYESKVLRAWREHHGVAFYADEKREFFAHRAHAERERAGAAFVVVENLS